MKISTSYGVLRLDPDARPSFDDKTDIAESLSRSPEEFRALLEACAKFGDESCAGFKARCAAWLAGRRGALLEPLPGGASVPVDEAGIAIGRPIPGPGSLYAERAAELALALARVVREARLYVAGTGSREHLINACISAEELL